MFVIICCWVISVSRVIKVSVNMWPRRYSDSPSQLERKEFQRIFSFSSFKWGRFLSLNIFTCNTWDRSTPAANISPPLIKSECRRQFPHDTPLKPSNNVSGTYLRPKSHKVALDFHHWCKPWVNRLSLMQNWKLGFHAQEVWRSSPWRLMKTTQLGAACSIITVLLCVGSGQGEKPTCQHWSEYVSTQVKQRCVACVSCTAAGRTHPFHVTS